MRDVLRRKRNRLDWGGGDDHLEGRPATTLTVATARTSAIPVERSSTANSPETRSCLPPSITAQRSPASDCYWNVKLPVKAIVNVA
jgi:hypothetical protein